MARSTDPLLALPDQGGLLYVRLYQRMRALILEGRWPAGMRLPSSRSLAADLGISRNTASLAIEQLLADGWIETRSRAGAFVGANVAAKSPGKAIATEAPRPGKLPVPFELTPGAMDGFPFGRWSRLQSAVWARSAPNLLYDDDRAGDPGLRQAIATVVAPARGMNVDPEQVIIVTGTQSALDLTAATIGGGTAVIEDPSYFAGRAVLAARGMEVVGIPVDGDGFDVDAARDAVPNPALILANPALQFPTCVTMKPERRSALLAWADDSGAWIVEDDYDADARFDGTRPPPPLREDASERVVTSVTFNRLLFRSLRLGFIVVPDTLRDRLLAVRSMTDEFVNLPNQLVLRRFIEEGGFTAHVRRCRELHAERRQAMLELLNPYAGSLFEPRFNEAGLHLIAKPLTLSAATVTDALRKAGIACTTLAEQSRLDDPPEGVLLGFAAFSPDVIAAMRPALAGALEPIR